MRPSMGRGICTLDLAVPLRAGGTAGLQVHQGLHTAKSVRCSKRAAYDSSMEDPKHPQWGQ
eukprot:11740228-Karenia_brevis.AAC.1